MRDMQLFRSYEIFLNELDRINELEHRLTEALYIDRVVITPTERNLDG